MGREAGFSAALLTMKLVSSSGRNDESLEVGGENRQRLRPDGERGCIATLRKKTPRMGHPSFPGWRKKTVRALRSTSQNRDVGHLDLRVAIRRGVWLCSRRGR
jgi:hypothetical protein